MGDWYAYYYYLDKASDFVDRFAEVIAVGKELGGGEDWRLGLWMGGAEVGMCWVSMESW